MTAKEWSEVYDKILNDPRYHRGIQYGKPRRGHAEGTIDAHIKQLTSNLFELIKRGVVEGPDNYIKLLILINVHDTFKGETAQFNKKNCPIEDPQSHSSLARAYLAALTDDQTMLNILQYHDLGYAIYRNFKQKGYINEGRLRAGLSKIDDLDLFLTFCVIDSCTPSKGREMIRWFVRLVNNLYPGKSKITEADILPGPDMVGESW